MNAWGYIWSGIGCAVAAGVLLALAQPSALDISLAAAQQAATPEANSGLQLVGFVFALAAAVLTPIGIIAEGVRIGSRASTPAAAAASFPPPSA